MPTTRREKATPKENPAPGNEPSLTAVDLVHAALTAHPASTAAELALHAGVGGSTARQALATLEAAGRATRHHTDPSQIPAGRRPAATWQPYPPADLSPTKTRKTGTTRSRPGDEGSTPTRPPSSTAKPRTATHQPPAQAEHSRAASTARREPPNSGTSATPALPEGKLARGQLISLVGEQLRAHPTQEWGARDLWRVLNRSQGAIGNALERLVTQGTAERSHDTPRRYRLTAPAAHPITSGHR